MNNSTITDHYDPLEANVEFLDHPIVLASGRSAALQLQSTGNAGVLNKGLNSTVLLHVINPPAKHIAKNIQVTSTAYPSVLIPGGGSDVSIRIESGGFLRIWPDGLTPQDRVFVYLKMGIRGEGVAYEILEVPAQTSTTDFINTTSSPVVLAVPGAVTGTAMVITSTGDLEIDGSPNIIRGSIELGLTTEVVVTNAMYVDLTTRGSGFVTLRMDVYRDHRRRFEGTSSTTFIGPSSAAGVVLS